MDTLLESIRYHIHNHHTLFMACRCKRALTAEFVINQKKNKKQNRFDNRPRIAMSCALYTNSSEKINPCHELI